MKNIIHVLSAFCLVGIGHSASAGTCKHRIIHIPQTHETSYAATASRADQDRIAESQFKIAQYIDRRSDLPVFSEQLTEKNISITDFPESTQQGLLAKGRSYFPQGLPENFEELNELQKTKLRDNGGEFIQVLRGRTKTLHAVISSPERKQELFGPFDAWFKTVNGSTLGYPPEIAEIVYTEREREAISQIKKHFELNPHQQDVILIYGANHDFTRHSDLFPAECVVIPAQFKAEWTPQRGYAFHKMLNRKFENDSSPKPQALR